MAEVLARGEARLVEVDVRIDGPRQDEEARGVDDFLAGDGFEALGDLGQSLPPDPQGSAPEVRFARQGD